MDFSETSNGCIYMFALYFPSINIYIYVLNVKLILSYTPNVCLLASLFEEFWGLELICCMLHRVYMKVAHIVVYCLNAIAVIAVQENR